MTTSRRLCSPKIGFPISAILRASSSSALGCPSVPSCKGKQEAEWWGKQSAKAKIHLCFVSSVTRCLLVCLCRVSVSQQPVKTICLCISLTAKINFEKTANTQEENLLYCLKRICCICNSLYTFIYFFLLLKNKRIERGSNINISLCVPSDSAAASFIFFPSRRGFQRPPDTQRSKWGEHKNQSNESLRVTAAAGLQLCFGWVIWG